MNVFCVMSLHYSFNSHDTKGLVLWPRSRGRASRGGDVPWLAFWFLSITRGVGVRNFHDRSRALCTIPGHLLYFLLSAHSIVRHMYVVDGLSSLILFKKLKWNSHNTKSPTLKCTFQQHLVHLQCSATTTSHLVSNISITPSPKENPVFISSHS